MRFRVRHRICLETLNSVQMQRWIKPLQFASAGFCAGYFIRRWPPFKPQTEVLEFSGDCVVLQENWRWDCAKGLPCTKVHSDKLRVYALDPLAEVWYNEGGGLSVFPSRRPQ